MILTAAKRCKVSNKISEVVEFYQPLDYHLQTTSNNMTDRKDSVNMYFKLQIYRFYSQLLNQLSKFLFRKIW